MDGWQIQPETQFAETFEEDIQSNDFRLSVAGEQFIQKKSPDLIDEGIPFSISGVITDRFGNIDLDFNKEEKIVILQGEVELGGVILFKDENGLFRWNGLKGKTSGKAAVEIQFPGTGIQPSRFTFEVVPEIKNLVQDDFEENDLSAWKNDGSWLIDTKEVISGTASLHHQSGLEGGRSCISYPHEKFNGDEYQSTWEFCLKNGNWNPSSSNNFLFFIGSGEYGQSQFSGYSLG